MSRRAHMPRSLENVTTALPVKEARRDYKTLSLRRLKRRLGSGRPLPKDVFVKTDLHGLHSNPYRHRDLHFNRSVLHALVGSSETKDHELALRIGNCRSKHRCGRLTCFICNQIYWSKRRKLVAGFATKCSADEISWCTVIIGVTHNGYPVVEDMVTAFKREFAQRLSHSTQTKWHGRIEIDFVDPKVVPVEPVKRRTYLALGWESDCEMAALVPHCHLIIVHPSKSRASIAYHLGKSFPESRQVQVKSFRVTRDRAVSLDHLTRYPLKPPLDSAYLSGTNSKNRIPRRPDVLRYMLRLHEALDRPSRRGLLEFDNV